MRHRVCGAESGQFRYCRAGSEVEEHAIAGDSSFPAVVEINLSGPRSYESSVAHNQFRAALRGGIDVHLMEPFHHQLFASLNRRHVDTQRLGFEAEFGPSPRE